MSKLTLYLLVFVLSVAALAADYRLAPETNRENLGNWRSLRSNTCAPCGAPCKDNL